MKKAPQVKRYMVSASRRNDCVANDPDQLARMLEGNSRITAPLKEGIVHTLLVSTKDPRNLLRHQALRKVVSKCEQICVNLTVTGFGGTTLEPMVPHWKELIQCLDELTEFLADPKRLVWCYDPILEWQGLSNVDIDLFSAIAEPFGKVGIERAFAMFYQPYKNSRLGIQSRPDNAHEFAQKMLVVCRDLSIDLSVCHMPGLHRHKCVDASWYAALHHDDDTELATHYQKQKKPHASHCRDPIWDIGWYLPRCSHRCLYCYAAPAIAVDNKID